MKKSSIVLLFLFIVFGGAVFVFGDGNVYNTTEHFGTDTNTNLITGAQRPANTPVAGYTINNTIFTKGNCIHCHDEHSQYGTTTHTPQKHNEFNLNNNNFCYTCHTNQTTTGGSQQYPVWNGSATYNASGHSTTEATNYWQGTNPAARPTTDTGKCLNCHNPHGRTFTLAGDPTGGPYNYLGTDPVLNLLVREEENLCVNCHKSASGVNNAKDINSQFTPGLGTTANASPTYYNHPINQDSVANDRTPSYHTIIENKSLTLTTRHVECADCHNPHYAKNNGVAGVSTHTKGNNTLSNALLGVYGVSVNNTVAWTAPTFTLTQLTSTTTNYEYQLCFRCHSSYSILPGYVTDQSVEFNTLNQAYHPIEATSPNIADMPTTGTPSFVAPWTKNSKMFCSDCHKTASGVYTAEGPHGSTEAKILNARFDEDTGDISSPRNTSTDLCFKCHDWNVYGDNNTNQGNTNASGFNNGASNLHQEHPIGQALDPWKCTYCHSKTPHGTNSQRHLIVTQSDAPPYKGVNSRITTYTHVAGAYGSGNCVVKICSGHGTAGATLLNQYYYRWCQDNAATPTLFYAAQNGAATDIPLSAVILRLRMQVGETNNVVTASTPFKLQWATSTGGPWTDLGAATQWNYANSAFVADGGALAAALLTAVLPTSNLGTYEEAANSTAYTYQNASREFDWVIAPTATVVAGTTYYFRMLNVGGTAITNYFYYPTLTTVAPKFKQYNYRWYNDDGVNNPTAMAAENIQVTNGSTAATYRLRVQVGEYNNTSGARYFKLQYSSNSGASYSDVGPVATTSDDWILANSSQAGVTDGTIVGLPLLLSATGLPTDDRGSFETIKPTAQFTLQNKSYEYDFVIKPVASRVFGGVNYLFRVVITDNTGASTTVLDGYNNTPTASLSAPIFQQYNYRWYNDDGINNPSAKAAENTQLNNAAITGTYRLRVSVGESNNVSGTQYFKLQYSPDGGTNYYNVAAQATATDDWRYVNSSQAGITDGLAITAPLLLTPTGLGTDSPGSFEEAQPTGQFTIQNASREFDFVIEPTPGQILDAVTYKFRVVMTDATGTPTTTLSTYNNTVLLKTVDVTNPSQITDFRVTSPPATAGGAPSVSFAWTAATDNSGTIDHYRLYRSTAGVITNANRGAATIVSDAIAGTTYTDNTIAPGANRYYYAICALDPTLNIANTSNNAKVGGNDYANGEVYTTGQAVMYMAVTTTNVNWNPAPSGASPQAITVKLYDQRGAPVTTASIPGASYTNAGVPANGLVLYQVVRSTNINSTYTVNSTTNNGDGSYTLSVTAMGDWLAGRWHVLKIRYINTANANDITYGAATINCNTAATAGRPRYFDIKADYVYRNRQTSDNVTGLWFRLVDQTGATLAGQAVAQFSRTAVRDVTANVAVTHILGSFSEVGGGVYTNTVSFNDAARPENNKYNQRFRYSMSGNAGILMDTSISGYFKLNTVAHDGLNDEVERETVAWSNQAATPLFKVKKEKQEGVGPKVEKITATPNPVNRNEKVTINTVFVDPNVTIESQGFKEKKINTTDDNFSGNADEYKISEAEYFIDIVGDNGNGMPLKLKKLNQYEISATAEIDTKKFKVGSSHSVFVHAKDIQGNWGELKGVMISVIDSNIFRKYKYTISYYTDDTLTMPLTTPYGAPKITDENRVYVVLDFIDNLPFNPLINIEAPGSSNTVVEQPLNPFGNRYIYAYNIYKKDNEKGVARVSIVDKGPANEPGDEVEALAGDLINLFSENDTYFSISAEPESIPADGKSKSTIMVKLLNANKEPASSKVIKFERLTGGGNLALQQAMTDNEGIATTEYISGITAETATIKATDIATNNSIIVYVTTSISGETEITLTPVLKTLKKPKELQKLSVLVLAYPQKLPADGISTSKIIAKVTDEDGEPVANADISFSLKAEINNSQAGMFIKGQNTTTDEKGIAESYYLAGKVPQLITIKATELKTGAQGSTNILLSSGGPAFIYVKAQPEVLPADGFSKSSINVKVTDLFGKPLSNIEIKLSLSDNLSGRLENYELKTNNSGEADTFYFAGNKEGKVKVIATVVSK